MSRGLDWNLVNTRLSAVERSFESALHPSGEEIERVYRERAARLATASLDRNAKQSDPVMLFRLGEERYSIELKHLTAVFRLQGVTPVPGTFKHIAGLVNVRGEIRPLINLKALMRIESPQPAKASYALLLNKGKPAISLEVDAVEGVGQFSREEAESLHGSPYVTFRTASTGMLLSAEALVDAMGENS